MTLSIAPGHRQRRTRSEMSTFTRGALVALGRAHFGERGYGGTSLEEITAAARLTRGALYHHFGSKNGLFIAVVDDIDAEIDHVFTSHIEAWGEDIDPLEQVRTALSCYFEAIQNGGVRQIIVRDAPNYYPGFSQRMAALRCRTSTISAFETLRAQGRALFIDSGAMVQMLEGAVAGLVNWAFDEGKSLAEINAEVDCFLSSIGRIQ